MWNLMTKKSWLFALLVVLTSGLVGCSSDAKRERHMKRAESYFQKGEYIKAEIEYRNAAQFSKVPDPRLVSRLATMYYEQGRIPEAFPLLTNAVALNPTDLDLKAKLGTVWISFRNYSNAQATAMSVLDKNPSHHEAMLVLADSAANSPERIAAVRARINDILRRSGETWSAHVALAALAIREEQLPTAEAQLQLAAKLDPKAAQASVVRAQIAALRNQPAEAEKFLRIAAENSPARSPRQLLLAQYKMEGTNIAEAKILADKLNKSAPDYVPGWVLRGQIALGEKDFAEAARISASVLAWNPLSYEIRLLRARALLLQQQPAKSIEEFERLIATYGNLPELKYEAAIAHLQAGSTTEALKKLDDAVQRYPDYEEAVLLRAELLLRSGAVDQAVQSLAAYTKNHKGTTRASLLLANAYRIAGRFDEALVLYRSFIGKSPTVPEFWFFEGMVLLQQRNIEKARRSFEQALVLAPGYFPAAEQMVGLDLAKKDYVAAQKRVDEQLKLSTNSPNALLLLAKVCAARRDFAGAEAALTKVIKADPAAVEPYSMLAGIYVASREPQKALTQLRTAVQQNPKDAGALLLMGTIHDSLKDYDQAKKAYEEAIRVNPKMWAAMNNLAYMLSENLNQVDEALSYATKAHELVPNEAGVGDTLGWIHYRRGELAKALPLLRSSAARMPEQVEVQYHGAMAEYACG